MRRMLIVLLAAAPAVWLHHAAPAARAAEQAPAATDADGAGGKAQIGRSLSSSGRARRGNPTLRVTLRDP